MIFFILAAVAVLVAVAAAGVLYVTHDRRASLSLDQRLGPAQTECNLVAERVVRSTKCATQRAHDYLVQNEPKCKPEYTLRERAEMYQKR